MSVKRFGTAPVILAFFRSFRIFFSSIECMIVILWKRVVSDLEISALGSFSLGDFGLCRFVRGSFRPNSVGRFGQSLWYEKVG